MVHDARALRGGGHVDSVPAVVAYHRLREIHDTPDEEPGVVDSVRRLVALGRESAGAELHRVGRRVDAAAMSDGPIEALCLRTAGGLTAIAMIDHDPAAAGIEVPNSIRARLEPLSSTMSTPPPLPAAHPTGVGSSTRPRSRDHAGWTRALLWRVDRIDWHLGFVATGLASCWDTELDDGSRHTDVPWVVAVAIAVSRRAGLTPARHATVPRPFRDDPPT